jgi:ABC-type Fe3+-siderophore transport system permease subunit
MTAASSRAGPATLAAGLGVAAAGLCTMLLAGPIAHLQSNPADPGSYDAERMVLLYATLPRLTMALLCGGALAAAGAILQQALRNPLASPTTLGVDAGARLALALTGLFIPDLIGVGRDFVALAGSATSTALVFLLVRRREFAAISTVLAGLVVSLYCGALATIFTLIGSRYLTSLFIWGSGSLSQQSWQPSVALAWRLALSAIPALFLLRPLTILELGDEASRGLGLPVGVVRAMAVGVAVLLSAFATSAVGVIGFIGLAAPLLARVSGARRFSALLFWSAVMGALLLLVTDAALQLVAAGSAELLPTGAATAVLGSPLLLVLLPRLKGFVQPPPLLRTQVRSVLPSSMLWLAAVALILFAALAVTIGRGSDGSWELLAYDRWDAIIPWRGPRLMAGAAAGGMLAMAGFMLQKLTNNTLASPEVLGVSAGAMLAVTLSLFVFSFPGGVAQPVIATLGGLAVLALILALSRRSAFAPERVLLAGVALSALADAAVGVLMAAGDPRAVMLLAWMGGSTSGTSTMQAVYAVAACAGLTALAALGVRWLTILPLGGPQALALGVPVLRARLCLLVLSAALTAAATPIVGPLTFIGLMAPHIVLAIGVRSALSSLVASMATGAVLMAVADTLARTIAFPVQLPTGLVAALVGGPFLMLLLSDKPKIA